MKSFLFFLLCCIVCYSESFKILVLYPLYVKSVNNLGEGAVRHLLNDGHEVTFITTHPTKIQNKNFRQIDISRVNIFENETSMSIGFIIETGIKETDVRLAQSFSRENARLVLQNENVTKILENPKEHFDLVIVDLFESEVYAGLSVLYNCPMIWSYSMGTHWQVLSLITDPGNPAYDTDYLGWHIPPFTFSQRVAELWSRIKWTYYEIVETKPYERELYKEVFGPLVAKQGRVLPDYDDVVYNASLIFANEHNAIIARANTPPNFKYIGGAHIEDPVKPLPKDLQELMDKAPHGVIYFSMGSFWKCKTIPEKLIRDLLDVFGELKETVIWKFEEEMKNAPKNVHFLRWAPQQSILAHPNLKLFISHGGLLSSIEAVHFGVPIIGIPVSYDQHVNVKKAVANGYAIQVDLNYDMPKNLRAAIKRFKSDVNYRNKVKELSWIYHDAPMKPGAELVHWVRHVIHTRGAPHLRSPALRVPLYQRLYLDLAALIILLLIALYVAVHKIVKLVIQTNKVVEEKKKQ